MGTQISRRSFLGAVGGVPLSAIVGLQPAGSRAAEAPTESGWRHFEVATRVVLVDAKGATQVWLPLAQTIGGYQYQLDWRWQSNARSNEVVYDAKYGAAIFHATWDGVGTRTLEVVQSVGTHDRTVEPFLPVTLAERQFYLQPTESVPTDGTVRQTVERVLADKIEPRERLRAIYDWVVDHTFRDAAVRGCGTGDIKSMLQSGHFGGKCADINSLMVGLARAAGFPARDIYGLRVANSKLFKCLGADGDVSKAQHCRAEAFLEGIGWFPMDPADVRKTILEQKLPLNSVEIRELRDRLFGFWEMNWIGYNSATDIHLPNTTVPFRANFLMYPYAVDGEHQLDWLDPTTFRYEIHSRELTG